MGKQSKDKMEEDEKKLLYALVKNAKVNIEAMAKYSGFSRQKVTRMIKQLEEKMLIWGYTTIFDEKKLGENHFILLLKRTSKPMKKETADTIISRRSEDILKNIGGTIETTAYVHGEYDWMVTFTAKDIMEAKLYANTLIALYPSEIKETSLLQTMMFVKKQYILNPDREKLREFL
jgi:DNA-binding Lrp family transcriptional regulator